MGRISWLGVVAGTVAALLTGQLLQWVVPNFHGLIPYEQGPGGGNVVSVERQMTADALWALTSGSAWTFAYFLGGLVSGTMARLAPGINGALVAVCGTFFGAINAVLAVGPAALANPENGAQVLAGIVAFGVLLPITVLVSYLGGRVAGRLRPGAASTGRE